MSRDVFRVAPARLGRALFGHSPGDRTAPPAWLTAAKHGTPAPATDPKHASAPQPERTSRPPAPSRQPGSRSAPPLNHAPAALDARLEAESLAAEMRESWRAPPPDTTSVAEALQELGQQIAILEEERRNALRGLERELWPLVRAIIERVLEREVRSDHTLALRLIREGLHALADANEVSVTLGPGFLETAENLESTLHDAGTPAKIAIDRSLPPYSCHVEAPLGRVDETIETRLDNILMELVPPGEEQ